MMHRRSGFVDQVLVVVATMLLPALAWAHVGVGETIGFAHGVGHPLGGLDHVCAMVAVGLWAGQRGGRAIWIVPAAFVLCMAVGGLAAALGFPLPFVERGIVFSVLALGVLVAAAARLPLVASALIVGLLAVFHGHAHGTEMPATVSGLAYGAGFVLATASLHALGIGVVTLVRRVDREGLVRFAGSAIAACGLALWLAA